MLFKDRDDAGTQLAQLLTAYADRADAIVLGVPRGGVPIAYRVALALRLPLDVFLAQKLGVPGQEELAFGAVSSEGIRYLDQRLIHTIGIPSEEVERITNAAMHKLHQRAEIFRRGRPPLSVEGRTVILVDNGIATGASVYAAILALRQMKPARLVLAVPVAPLETCRWLRSQVDELVCVSTPLDFYAVGQFYEEFTQVSDEEVLQLLRRADYFAQRRTTLQAAAPSAAPPATPPPEPIASPVCRDLLIPIDQVSLAGTLAIPPQATSIVLFVHGSGSSRNSPRNRHVAEVLQQHGLATLLFDLLTPQEDLIDQRNAELRFDIEMLSQRLIQVTHWVARQPQTQRLSIGYFGASTGAAAALIAAAQLPHMVSAVVSRGGRPDLAFDALLSVTTPTLFLVGSLDGTVLQLNRQAYAKLAAQTKELRIISGATHLFEEPGTLDEVAQAAAEWFTQHLHPQAQRAATGTSAGGR